ncbi:hypothetical protein DFH11DRAFT_1166580 [Phellopilus nigrolimitatus]|nr:hypothetical protein DFH11DRAFT_1166580 [Phellopilus nigrolimitatus]
MVVCMHFALEQFAPDSLFFVISHFSVLCPAGLPQKTPCRRLSIPVPRCAPARCTRDACHLRRHVQRACASCTCPVMHSTSEYILYVGDTVYEWKPVLFPPEGDLVVWFASMDFLVDFVYTANRESVKETE